MPHLQYSKLDEYGKLDSDIDKESVTGCWVWRGIIAKRHKSLRPVLYHNRKSYYADRLAYTRAYGILPPGSDLVKVCKTPNCINPGHMKTLIEHKVSFTPDQIAVIGGLWSSGSPIYRILESIGMSSSSGFYKRLRLSGYRLVTKREIEKIDAR